MFTAIYFPVDTWKRVVCTCSMIGFKNMCFNCIALTFDLKSHTVHFGIIIQLFLITPCPAEPRYILSLQTVCRSRSVGFWRSQLIWICTVCYSLCEFISTIWIKKSDWLTIISGCGILIYSAGQGLRAMFFTDISDYYFRNGRLMA